jgi:hypothetical protein
MIRYKQSAQVIAFSLNEGFVAAGSVDKGCVAQLQASPRIEVKKQKHEKRLLPLPSSSTLSAIRSSHLDFPPSPELGASVISVSSSLSDSTQAQTVSTEWGEGQNARKVIYRRSRAVFNRVSAYVVALMLYAA